MTKKKIPTKVKFVVRPSQTALKVALTLLIVFSTAALIALWWVHGAISAETEKLRDEAAGFEYSNAELENRVHNPDSEENIQKVAEEELGLVDPDTLVLTPQS